MATQLTSAGIQGHELVSPNEWIASRKELLRKEKEFTKLRDELTRQRRELPWEKVEKQYVFDGPNGKETLADLFDGKSQLIVYHFMFGPGWDEGCPSCSFLADHFDGSLVHLANRDVTLVVVSRALRSQIEAFKKRMGWHFKWVSSFGNHFNRDYHVSFTKEEMAKGKVPYNYDMVEFGSEKDLGQASSIRTLTETSSIPIRRTLAGSTFWSGRTTSSTWRRKVGTKMVWPSAWRGFDITTNTLRATWSIQRRSTWPRRARDRHAARRSTTRDRPSPSLLRWCLKLF